MRFHWDHGLKKLIALAALLLWPVTAAGADVFIRVKVIEPTGAQFKITFGGHRHAGEPWQFPEPSTQAAGGAWSPWTDLSKWPWHGKIDRVGGVAEWPSMRVGVQRLEPAGPTHGCTLEV